MRLQSVSWARNSDVNRQVKRGGAKKKWPAQFNVESQGDWSLAIGCAYHTCDTDLCP